MDRYSALFERLDQQHQGAFVPFVTLGDPTPQLSLEIIDTLVDSGADALELGFPFSDPLADGPTIQGANIRALQSNTTPDICFEIITQIRTKYPKLPIGLLVYANLVYANGMTTFYQKCAQAGVDSVLIADVPTLESAPFLDAATASNIKTIFIAPPTANDETLQQVASLGSGYTYLLSRSGVTGVETQAQMPVASMLSKLNQFNAPPALLGFGISQPSQVKSAIQSGAAGAIAGSAVVNIIAEYKDEPKQLMDKMKEYIKAMKQATHK